MHLPQNKAACHTTKPILKVWLERDIAKKRYLDAAKISYTRHDFDSPIVECMNVYDDHIKLNPECETCVRIIKELK